MLIWTPSVDFHFNRISSSFKVKPDSPSNFTFCKQFFPIQEPHHLHLIMTDKAHLSHTMLAQSKCFINSPVHVFNLTDISFKSPNFLNFLHLHLLLSSLSDYLPTIQPALIVNMMHKLYCSSIICMSCTKQPSMLFTATILSSFPGVFFLLPHLLAR